MISATQHLQPFEAKECCPTTGQTGPLPPRGEGAGGHHVLQRSLDAPGRRWGPRPWNPGRRLAMPPPPLPGIIFGGGGVYHTLPPVVWAQLAAAAVVMDGR